MRDKRVKRNAWAAAMAAATWNADRLGVTRGAPLS
jgi:hypothetical protein